MIAICQHLTSSEHFPPQTSSSAPRVYNHFSHHINTSHIPQPCFNERYAHRYVTSPSSPACIQLSNIQALRGALSALSPRATSTTLLPRITSSLAQTRLLSQEVRTAIDKAVASAPVVLFMKGTPETPQCGFSRTSIQILGLQGVDPRKFTAFNVLEDEELRSGTSLTHASSHGFLPISITFTKSSTASCWL